jgi:hypothetical protein
MLKITLAATLLVLAITPSSAYAASCEGQKGKVIFEDDFTDDSGGWTTERGATWDASFGKSGLTLHIQQPAQVWNFWNLSFAATEGDFCLEAVVPKPAAADIVASTSMNFLASLVDSKMNSSSALQIGSDSAITLWRFDGGNWGKLANLSDPKIKLESESVVALRVVAKANLITASVDGIELKKMRVQVPGGKFGIGIETGKPVPAPGVMFQFKRYKVTAGE